MYPKAIPFFPGTAVLAVRSAPCLKKRDETGIWRGFRVEEYHTNGMLNAHGGMLMTFADMSWGAAVEKDEDTWWVTVRLMCDFLSGAPKGSFVEGKGEVVGRQDDVFTVEGKIWTRKKLIMRGTGVFKVIARRPGLPGRGADAEAETAG